MTKRTALFAGGCFWCMQPVFDNEPGVIKTTVGYSGGTRSNPSYEQVTTGVSGHREVIQIEYNDDEVSYARLLEIYWQSIDPFDAEGQFADRGKHYETAIFYADEMQKETAEISKEKLQNQFPDQPLATDILPAQPFYPAEDYHQSYYQKNANHYERYKYGSGRVRRLEELWGKK